MQNSFKGVCSCMRVVQGAPSAVGWRAIMAGKHLGRHNRYDLNPFFFMVHNFNVQRPVKGGGLTGPQRPSRQSAQVVRTHKGIIIRASVKHFPILNSSGFPLSTLSLLYAIRAVSSARNAVKQQAGCLIGNDLSSARNRYHAASSNVSGIVRRPSCHIYDKQI
jgi:hypothetical protein